MSYWRDIVSHPEIEPFVFRGRARFEDFEWLLSLDHVSEERYPGGGFVFVSKEGYEEIHVAFLPEYWGRPIAMAFRDCFSRKMKMADTVVAHEWEDNWRSKPPRSYGFVSEGGFEETIFGVRNRKWVLTREAWEASPVFRKMI